MDPFDADFRSSIHRHGPPGWHETSGQVIKYFKNLGFPEIRGRIPYFSPTIVSVGWCEVAIIWSDIYICIMYVRYIYIYHIIQCLQTKMLMISFLALIFFSFRQIGQNTRDPNSLFPLERSQPHRQFDVPNFPAPDALAPPIGRLVQEEKLRHLGCNAVKTGCSCLDGFENSRVQPWLFFLSAGFQGWSSSSPIFFTPFFPGKHQTCLERTLQSWCILYFQEGFKVYAKHMQVHLGM